MEIIREASFAEFRRGFLARLNPLPSDQILNSPSQTGILMCTDHKGKIDQDIFWEGSWTLRRIESIDDLRSLVILAGGWTTKHGLLRDGRLLGQVVAVAKEQDYFRNSPYQFDDGTVEMDGERIARLKYWDEINRLDLMGKDRIVLRRLNPGESNVGTYYLHDGLGRMLRLMYALEWEEAIFPSINALVVE